MFRGLLRPILPVLLGLALLVAACSADSSAPTEPPVATEPPRGSAPVPADLSQINDYLYQLQDLDLQAVGESRYDLVIMDYAADGTAATEYTADEIQALRESPGGSKVLLAYMSIGEAEDYRFYWQDGWAVGDPPWLDAENPNWEGNYKVRYWEDEWRGLIFDYTNRLIAAGFDGAYLDIIDAYQYFIEQGAPEEVEESPARRMADLVAAIADHARAKDPDFLIFPQNAPELASMVPDYLDHVDGIGQEDIYYGHDEDDVGTPTSVTAELERHLDRFRERGKLVLTIDYATSVDKIDDAYVSFNRKRIRTVRHHQGTRSIDYQHRTPARLNVELAKQASEFGA